LEMISPKGIEPSRKARIGQDQSCINKMGGRMNRQKESASALRLIRAWR